MASRKSSTRSSAKTLEIAVEPDASVVIAAPEDATLDAIEAKLRKRAAWVTRQQRYFSQFLPRTPERRFVAEETHLYLGRQYRLRFDASVVAGFSSEHESWLEYDPISRTGFFNWTAPDRADLQPVAVVAAGSSDMPQAAEAIRTLTYFGVPTERFIDVGVAGLWRLLEEVDRLKTFPVFVVIAGMDGALPSVLGGLVPGSIICVPTSTGYGASRGGETALHAALSSCAPGLFVVNIDNRYGAACAAYRVVNMVRQHQEAPPTDRCLVGTR